MPHEADYSIPKKDLTPEEFDTYLEGTEVRAAITRNMEIGAQIVKEGRGIFGIPEFTKLFTFDGSIKTKNDPKQSAHYGPFFSLEGRFAKKGDDYILRGTNYLVSIDPTLEVGQKINTIQTDFVDAVDALSLDGPVISSESYLEQSATLDYLKNAALTLFNALIQEEKIGKFYLHDEEYQRVRKLAVELGRYATQAYYAHLIDAKEDYASVMSLLIEKYEQIQEVTGYIEKEYREGIFQYRHFTRPEAGHPLIIGASVFTTVHQVHPMPETIIGLPSGGSELAFAQQYAYKAIVQHDASLVLVPLSLHSIKDAFDTERIDKDGFKAFLRSREEYLRGKKILIVEDNSSTGRTIQLLHDLLTELFNVQGVNVSVAESDLIRSTINSEAAHRTHVASNRTYAYSVSMLPISKNIRPKVDLKEIAETRRLSREYRRKLDESEVLADQIMYRAFIKMCEKPTEDVLEKLDSSNAVLDFRYTFLSNFYAVPITYAGQHYPSVEHAYHAQKFTTAALSGVSRECMEEINELLRVRGRLEKIEYVGNVFTDQTLLSGTIKAISDTLRKHGYVRSNWDDDKMRLMADLLLQKFENTELGGRLLATGNKYLVEGNTWNDTLWGVSNGRGRNLLGLMLMEVREALHQNKKKPAES